jgi:nucleotide-binding universal stress UspA family protein
MLIAVHSAQEHSTANPDNARADADDPSLVEEVRSLVTDVTEGGIRGALRVVNSAGMQPAQCIADMASDVRADMIVVGTRVHSAVDGVFAGSVAQRLLQVAPCPLLAVPPRAAAPEAGTDSAGATQPMAAGSATELQARSSDCLGRRRYR